MYTITMIPGDGIDRKSQRRYVPFWPSPVPIRWACLTQVSAQVKYGELLPRKF
jgi:hypothetical protein